MKILAIDTSCDDTAIAIIEGNGSQFRIKSNIVSSQVKIHQKYGGVYPSLAKREHLKNLPLVLKKALGRNSKDNIDALAVTIGPGLEPCLWTGINFAKELAQKWSKPFIPVNHLEAHILANWLMPSSKKIEFPAPMRAANVRIICPKCGKPTRVGYKMLTGDVKNKKLRRCNKCKEVIE